MRSILARGEPLRAPGALAIRKLILAALVLGGCASTVPEVKGPSQTDAKAAAMDCSAKKLKEYVPAITEPASEVAAAAFNACLDLWDVYVDAVCRDTRICDPVFRLQYRDSVKRGFVNTGMSIVVEQRAKMKP
jgi:hypothetical protein